MKKANYPEEIPVYLDWDFDERAPQDFDAFLKTVKAAQDSVTAQMGFVEKMVYRLSNTKLSAQLPLKKAKFRFDYATQLPNHEWQDHVGEIVIEQDERITFGQLQSCDKFSGTRRVGEDSIAIRRDEATLYQKFIHVTVLYALYFETGGNLFGKDIMAIEAIELDEALSSDALPVYHIWFGD